MRIKLYATLPMGVGAQYDGKSHTIEMNIPLTKYTYPYTWRRVLVGYFAHEFVHWIYDFLMIGWPWHGDLYKLYKEELICYKVTMLLGCLMGLPMSVSTQEGAIKSITHVIHAIKSGNEMNGR